MYYYERKMAGRDKRLGRAGREKERGKQPE